MSNKTALQELIEDIEVYKEEAMTYRNVRELTALNYVLIKCSLLEEKEKQQIMEAYNSGYSEGYLDSDNKGMGFCSPSDYYNEKYGNPQGDPETKQ